MVGMHRYSFHLSDDFVMIQNDIQYLLDLDVSLCRMRRYSFLISEKFFVEHILGGEVSLPPISQLERALHCSRSNSD